MTIYDLKLYGVHFPRLVGGTKAILSHNQIEAYGKAPHEYRFEVTVLKEYGTKQDVLWLQFVDGHSEYITLYEPFMYLEDGEWKPAQHRNVAEAFLAKYNEIKEIQEIGINANIFELTFYGIQEDFCVKPKRVEISLSRASRDRCLTKNSMLFTATILKEYKGNKYVIKLLAEGGETCYIPLFDANMYYDEEKRRWEYCNESPIPGKILKCYVQYLNG